MAVVALSLFYFAVKWYLARLQLESFLDSMGFLLSSGQVYTKAVIILAGELRLMGKVCWHILN